MTDNQKIKLRSCITDSPLKKLEEDRLDAAKYAEALFNFIVNADTPVTIGIQGGWGSGKTSLISLLREMLNEDKDHAALCVFVNAWEHSLFHSSENKADVALSLLGGLSDGIREEAIANKKWLGSEIIDEVENKRTLVDKAVAGIGMALRFGLKAATTYALGNAVSIKSDKKETEEMPPSVAKSVHELRENLEGLVTTVTKKDVPSKVVFFIDDLDRVPPQTAVELLDIIKNIFSIPNCVFVLAIDYEVVVKGLEGKFGAKNAENEREFRQYFDKIIQIPFTMPVGAYATHINKMLEPALKALKYNLTDDNGRLLKNLAEESELATGGIPRSIKRIVNTLSLLQHIADVQPEEKSKDNDSRLEELEIRFIIVALHINFPEICRRLMERGDFTAWKLADLDKLWKLNWSENEADLNALNKDEFFNDEWEKVVYCLCAKTEWLKSQAANVSKLLNKLREALKAESDKTLPGDAKELLGDIMDSIRIVSIDTESANQEIDDSSVKTDRCTVFCQKLHDTLTAKFPKSVVARKKEYAKRGGNKDRLYFIDLPELEEGYVQICWYKNKEQIFFEVVGSKLKATVPNTKKVLEQVVQKAFDYNVDRTDFLISSGYEFLYDDFSELNFNQYIDDIGKMMDLAKKVQKVLKG